MVTRDLLSRSNASKEEVAREKRPKMHTLKIEAIEGSLNDSTNHALVDM